MVAGNVNHIEADTVFIDRRIIHKVTAQLHGGVKSMAKNEIAEHLVFDRQQPCL